MFVVKNTMTHIITNIVVTHFDYIFFFVNLIVVVESSIEPIRKEFKIY